MVLTRALSTLALAAALAACGSAPAPEPTGPAPDTAETATGPRSVDALARAVVAALAARDRDAFLALLPPEDLVLARCPDIVARAGRDAVQAELARNRERSLDAFDHCPGAAWGRATLHVPESERIDDHKCAAATYWRSVAPSAVLEGAPWTLRIDDPVALDGRFYVAGHFDCAEGAEPALVPLRQGP